MTEEHQQQNTPPKAGNGGGKPDDGAGDASQRSSAAASGGPQGAPSAGGTTRPPAAKAQRNDEGKPVARPAAARAGAARTPATASGASQATKGDGKGTVTRRDFLHWALWGSALLWLGQFAGSFANYFWPLKTGFFGQRINIGPLSQYPVGSVTRVDAGKFYLVRTEEGLIALYWRCTHLGCTVPWRPEERADVGGCFCCPCHGSQFNRVGEKIGGPAPRPLDYFPVEVDADGNVWVDTGRVQERQAHSPEHMTKV